MGTHTGMTDVQWSTGSRRWGKVAVTHVFTVARPHTQELLILQKGFGKGLRWLHNPISKEQSDEYFQVIMIWGWGNETIKLLLSLSCPTAKAEIRIIQPLKISFFCLGIFKYSCQVRTHHWKHLQNTLVSLTSVNPCVPSCDLSLDKSCYQVELWKRYPLDVKHHWSRCLVNLLLLLGNWQEYFQNQVPRGPRTSSGLR